MAFAAIVSGKAQHLFAMETVVPVALFAPTMTLEATVASVGPDISVDAQKRTLAEKLQRQQISNFILHKVKHLTFYYAMQVSEKIKFKI